MGTCFCCHCCCMPCCSCCKQHEKQSPQACCRCPHPPTICVSVDVSIEKKSPCLVAPSFSRSLSQTSQPHSSLQQTSSRPLCLFWFNPLTKSLLHPQIPEHAAEIAWLVNTFFEMYVQATPEASAEELIQARHEWLAQLQWPKQTK